MPVTYERAAELNLAPSAPSGSPTLDAHLAERPPTLLYHYTSADGLQGIMKSRTLFATNIMFMNDLKEVDHLLEQVELIKFSHAQAPDRQRLIKEITSQMHSAARRRYISSLSALSNSLSQWRGYSRGGGYAIGLSSKRLQLMASQQGYTLCKCIYDDNQTRKIVNEIIDYYEQRFQNLKADGKSEDEAFEQIKWEAGQHLVRIGPVIKGSAFNDECEWRLISPSINEDPKMKFRSQRGLLTPYVEFRLSRDDNDNWTHKGDIDQMTVTVGPTTSERARLAAASALQYYATSLGWAVAVSHSNILFDDIR